MKRLYGGLILWSMIAVVGASAQLGQAKLKEGEAAPEFSEVSTGGGEASLAKFRGRWLALYFFVKAETPLGEEQAVAMRDAHDEIRSLKANVLGVSRDNLDTLKAFKAQHHLPFDLVSDTNKTMAEAYGVVGFGGLPQRRTFLIDPRGDLAGVLSDVTVDKHGLEVAAALRNVQAAAERKTAGSP